MLVKFYENYYFQSFLFRKFSLCKCFIIYEKNLFNFFTGMNEYFPCIIYSRIISLRKIFVVATVSNWNRLLQIYVAVTSLLQIRHCTYEALPTIRAYLKTTDLESWILRKYFNGLIRKELFIIYLVYTLALWNKYNGDSPRCFTLQYIIRYWI